MSVMTRVTMSDDGQRLAFQGAMTVSEVPGLLASLGAHCGVTHVDLHAVDRVDSSALSVLLALSRAAGGTTVTVYHAPSALRALSDLYGLQNLFWVV